MLSPFLFIENLISYAPGATAAGFTNATLHFVLFAPILIVFVVAARQIIGLRGVGIAAPLVSIYLVAQTGVALGFIVVSSVIAAGFITRLFLKYTHLLFLPRIGLFILVAIGSTLPFVFIDINNRSTIPFITPLIVITALVLTERLFEGNRPPVFAAAEFLSILLAGVIIIRIEILDYIFLVYPWLSFALGVILLVFLGRWTGLRLTEYFRFRSSLDQ
ncbi:MAG: hypothetical protein HYV65_01675 [Candidatus Spechtbacteria bacterium]|nr:hypothetical protein [Candidatus Spechtbacteria bacterium]